MRSWPATVAFGGDYNPDVRERRGLRVVSAGARTGSLRDVLARPGDGPAGRRRQRRRPGDWHGVPRSWLSRTYPQSLPVGREGRALWPGGRQAWCPSRYGTPDAVDEAWGASFRSQRHAWFEDVLPPRLAPTPSNPTQVLDYARCTSDTLLDAYRAERGLEAPPRC